MSREEDRFFFIKLIGYLDKSSDYQNYLTSAMSLLMTYVGFLLGFLSASNFQLNTSILTKWEAYPFLVIGIIFLFKANLERKEANKHIDELLRKYNHTQTQT